jgi:hypothetical protein
LQPEVAMDHMRMVNAARTKYEGWPESPWQRALFDRF